MKKNKTHSSYYIAYGSNLNVEQMTYRCCQATVVGRTTLNNHRLIFRGNPGNTHATVEPAAGYKVPIVVWKITSSDEIALDAYEGVPRYYTKEYIPLLIDGECVDALIYVMVNNPIGPPSSHYYETIKRGYEYFGLEMEILETALIESTGAT